MSESDQVAVTLSKAEALVLFELCWRSDDPQIAGQLDAAERVALDALGCALESVLVEPFRGDYPQILEQARRSLEIGGESE